MSHPTCEKCIHPCKQHSYVVLTCAKFVAKEGKHGKDKQTNTKKT